MSNPIKVTFAEQIYLNILVLHPSFNAEFDYLAPDIDSLNIRFNDDVKRHNRNDSEEIILTAIANFLCKVDPNAFHGKIEFLNSIAGQQKGGISIGGNVIINSTDI